MQRCPSKSYVLNPLDASVSEHFSLLKAVYKVEETKASLHGGCKYLALLCTDGTTMVVPTYCNDVRDSLKFYLGLLEKSRSEFARQIPHLQAFSTVLECCVWHVSTLILCRMSPAAFFSCISSPTTSQKLSYLQPQCSSTNLLFSRVFLNLDPVVFYVC